MQDQKEYLENHCIDYWDYHSTYHQVQSHFHRSILPFHRLIFRDNTHGSTKILRRTKHIMKVIDAVPTAPPKKTLVIMKSRSITKVFTLFLAVRIDAIITKYVNILAEHLNARGEIQTEVVL